MLFVRAGASVRKELRFPLGSRVRFMSTPPVVCAERPTGPLWKVVSPNWVRSDWSVEAYRPWNSRPPWVREVSWEASL